MKIVLVTGSTSSMVLTNWFLNQQLLAGVAIQNVLNDHNPGMRQWLQQRHVNQMVVDGSNMGTEFYQWIDGIKPDLVIVFGFSYIIPKKFFDLAEFGFYNIHFSLLPAYKGPSPLFWQLLNGEIMSGVSIHRMSEKADSGEVMVQLSYQIGEDDTLGLLHIKLSDLVIPAVQQFLQLGLYEVEKPAVVNAYGSKESYQKRPAQADILINWEKMSASRIRSLVQASNPVYQGACTFFKEMEVRILQSSVLKSSPEPGSGRITKAGEILKNTTTLCVGCCCGDSLQIEIIATSIGVMTGEKWKQLFIKDNDHSVLNIFS